MTCPLCGEVCRCLPESQATASSRLTSHADSTSAPPYTSKPQEPALSVTHLVNPDTLDLSEQRFTASLEADISPRIADEAPQRESSTGEASDANTSAESIVEGTVVEEGPAPSNADQDPNAWRDEVAARLNRYRARRKASPPRYPSLRLRFEEHPCDSGSAASPSAAFETASNQALALDRLTEHCADQIKDRAEEKFPPPLPALAVDAPASSAPSLPSAGQGWNLTGAKVIEFPRSVSTVQLDELADPVLVRPRILEVPEVAPPAPALGGITMEGIQQEEVEKRPGIDVPLQSAPMIRRIVAAAIDGLIITAASGLFGAIFWKVAVVRPPRFQLLGLAASIPCLFWAVYEYLLIVYSASTPGLRLAHLELACFDGSLANRRLRRWRVLASYLSAVSLGLGYAWIFLDEDGLCWHDRITHTYLAPRQRETIGHNSAA